MDDPNVATNKTARGKRTPRLTGRANAMTRGKGRKLGLKRTMDDPARTPPERSNPVRTFHPAVPRPPARGIRGVVKRRAPGSGAPAPTNPDRGTRAADGKRTLPAAPPVPRLTGTANALTRGQGRKVGLREKAGMPVPPAPPAAYQKGRSKR